MVMSDFSLNLICILCFHILALRENANIATCNLPGIMCLKLKISAVFIRFQFIIFTGLTSMGSGCESKSGGRLFIGNAVKLIRHGTPLSELFHTILAFEGNAILHKCAVVFMCKGGLTVH